MERHKRQQPPVAVQVREEVCGQSFHGERESKETCVKSTFTFLWAENVTNTFVGGM